MKTGVTAPSSLATLNLRWHVFLSFRGEDTRLTITQRLYEALEKAGGLRVFLDNDGMQRGDVIAPTLLEAIENSAASIIVLSKRYADSHWCLNELTRICELKRLILPIFYGVNRADIREQKSPYEDFFKKHEEDCKNTKTTFKEADVKKWRKAMAFVASLPGFRVEEEQEEQENKMIKSVVKRVLFERDTPVTVPEHIVGLDSPLKDLMNLLDITSKGVQVLGIYGEGGIGKTTLTKALYSKLVAHFDCCTFISNVRENSRNDDTLNSLQSKLIQELFKHQILHENVDDGLKSIRKMVHEKKVLIALDDVDNVSQLNALVGKKEWFGDGTIVVINTRYEKVLLDYQVSNPYEVRELGVSDALELFNHHSHRGTTPTNRFFYLSKEIISEIGSFPLVLQVFGSLLYKKEEKIWESHLANLKNDGPKALPDILEISFNELDQGQQCMFLDIACLFVTMAMKREDVIDTLKSGDFQSESTIELLTERCFIKINEDNDLLMHDQLREMGKQIDKRKEQSILWDRDEILAALKNNMQETGSLRGIVLDYKKNDSPSASVVARYNLVSRHTLTSLCRRSIKEMSHFWSKSKEEEFEALLDTESFKSMAKLRLLQINYTYMKGNFTFLPSSLKWLQWKGCPLETLPSDFTLEELAILDLSESGIKRVWSSKTKKVGQNLMVMNLLGCYNLEDIPDLSNCKNLEKLVLERCHSLVKMHSSIGACKKLIHLNLRDCKNLTNFPTNVSCRSSLKKLILSGCLKLNELPENICSLTSLEELLVDDTSITELPAKIFRLVKLRTLSLTKCKLLKHLPQNLKLPSSLKELNLSQSGLENLPDSIKSLENLEKLSLIQCESLLTIPKTVGNLESLVELSVCGTGIQELPASIGSLKYLKHFNLRDCKSLSSLPDSIGGLVSLVELQLDNTPINELPSQIGSMESLQNLHMLGCTGLKSLPESIGGMWALTGLYLDGSAVAELPSSIHRLENLVLLHLNGCTQLHKLPDKIGHLKSLRYICMQDTAVTELPDSFGRLSSLILLTMCKKPLLRLPNNVDSGRDTGFTKLPMSFSHLSSLKELDARSCRIYGHISNDFEKLSSLEMLNLGNNYLTSLPSSMGGLSVLKKLLLEDCQELISVPSLPPTLEVLNLANCISLESVCDMSNLKNLQDLNCTNCVKLFDVPGLECLESLKRLYMSCCNACFSAIKRRLSQGRLRKLQNLSMPGSKIPDWFCRDPVTSSTCGDREIRGVMIGVVVSLDNEIPDDLRYNTPAVVNIEIHVLESGISKHTIKLDLLGLPNNNEDQLHLCRYPFSHQLISFLKEGCKIQVMKRDPQNNKGVELKLSGIHLIYEDDDDCRDERSFNDSLQTDKLVNFFSLIEDN